MELEKQNIEMIKPLLEIAITALDAKFNDLPKEPPIKLDQLCDVIAAYGMVNYLRNVIVNQLNYLDNESNDDKESEILAKKINDEWFAEINDVINGFKMQGNPTALVEIPDGYITKMRRIKILLNQKLDSPTITDAEKIKIQNALNIVRTAGQGRNNNVYRKIKELFNDTNDKAFQKQPEAEKERIRSSTLLAIEGKLERSNTGVLSSALESSQLKKTTKKDFKKENKELVMNVVTHIFNNLSAFSHEPLERLGLLQQLQKQYSDLLAKNAELAEKISQQILAEVGKDNALRKINGLFTKKVDKKTILQLDAILKEQPEIKLPSKLDGNYEAALTEYEADLNIKMENLEADNKLSVMDKIKELDRLITERSTHGPDVIKIYQSINEKLTKQLATQIVDFDRELFSQISINAIVYRDANHPATKNIIDFFNNLSESVVVTMMQSDINLRVLMFERLVKLAIMCRNLGDFHGSMAIVVGLNRSEVGRLKSTVKALSLSTQKDWQILNDDYSMTSSYKNLRRLVSEHKGPVVPYIGTYMSDVTFFIEGNNNTAWQDANAGIKIAHSLINAQKTINSNALKPLSQDHSLIDLVNKPVTLKNQTFQHESEALNNQLYKLSLEYEPKNTDIAATIQPELLVGHQLLSPLSEVVSAPEQQHLVSNKLLHGSVDLFMRFDQLLNNNKMFSHEPILSLLHGMGSENINHIINYNKSKIFVDVSEDEFKEILVKLKEIEGHPNFTNATVNNLNYEQIEFIIKYYRLREKVENGKLEYKVYEGHKVTVDQQSKILYKDKNGGSTNVPLINYYDYKNGKLVKRDVSLGHRNDNITQLLLAINGKSAQDLDASEKNISLINFISKSLSEIDDALNISFRQALSKPLNPDVFIDLAYIVNQKYDAIIAMLGNTDLEDRLKAELIKEKEKFEQFNVEMQLMIKQNLLIPEAVLQPAAAPSQLITPAIIPETKFRFILPLDKLNEYKANIDREREAVELETPELTHTQLQDRINRADEKILENKKFNEESQKKFIDQIELIAKSPEPLNALQAMVIVSNIRALLSDDFNESIEGLTRINTDAMVQLLEKLYNFQSTPHNFEVRLLHDLCYQLNFLINYARENLLIDSEDWFKKFKTTYEISKQSMETSKDLFNYYNLLDQAPAAQVSMPEISLLPIEAESLSSQPLPSQQTPKVLSDEELEKLKKKHVFPPVSSENQEQQSRIIPLLDVDNTLVMGNDLYNDELINALAEQGISEVYLFTSYSSNGAGTKENKGSRDKLTQYLASKNIKVLGVIVEDDVLYQRGLGEWYKDKLLPLEQAAATNSDTLQKDKHKVEVLEMEFRMGMTEEQFNQLSSESQKKVLQIAKSNSPNKGDMFKYVVSQLGSQHTYFFIDDDIDKNFGDVKAAAEGLNARVMAIPVTAKKKKQQYIDEMSYRRDWIKEAEQYRRVFQISTPAKKPELKIIIKEGDLTTAQLMDFANTPGSVFNSLTKTLWMVMNGSKHFHVPGEDRQHTAASNRELIETVKNKPHILLNEDESFYAQALNRYVVTTITDKDKNKNIKGIYENVYISATAAPQLDDPQLWHYRFLIVDPVQNTKDNVNDFMRKMRALQTPGNVFDQSLNLLPDHKIPTYSDVLRDVKEHGNKSRYVPLVNKEGEFIQRAPNGGYVRTKQFDIEKCIFIDKKAYLEMRVKEIAAKLQGFNDWLKQQDAMGSWRAVSSGINAFAWLGGNPDYHIKEDMELFFYEAYKIVMERYQFDRIKEIEFPIKLEENDESPSQNSQYNAYKKVFLDDEVRGIGKNEHMQLNVNPKKLSEPGMTFTNFSTMSSETLKGIDACPDNRTPLGNELAEWSAEPIIINAASGARLAGSPWTSPEMLNPDNWMIETLDGSRQTITEYLADIKQKEPFQIREQFEQRKPDDIKDLEIWTNNRSHLFELILNEEYDEFNDELMHLNLSEQGKRQIVEVIFEAILNNDLDGKQIISYDSQIKADIPIENFTLDPILPSHYELLMNYKKSILNKFPNNKMNFTLPRNHAARMFIEDNIEQFIGIVSNTITDATKRLDQFLEFMKHSYLSPSQKLEVCEILFNFVKENKVRNSRGEENIYKLPKGEKMPLFADLLSENRQPLLNEQIELIKLIKRAYVDIIHDSQNGFTNQEEKAAIAALLKNKTGVVDFQNSNTPINIPMTGTRRKITDLMAKPLQDTEGDRFLEKELAKVQLMDLDQIVDAILKAQKEKDNEMIEKYISEYLGKRKYGILTRNYREEFIKVAIENGNAEFAKLPDNLVEPISPLLRLAKHAEPELKKAIINTEILDSHFWKGHPTSKKYISEALHEGRPTLEDFRRYSANFAMKQESQMQEISKNKDSLVTAISGTTSVAVKEFLLKQIGHMKIDFLEGKEFNDFLTKFIMPMVAALNIKYRTENEFPENYNEFYHLFNKAPGLSITAEKNMFLTSKFIDNFNQAMAHNSKLAKLERLTAPFNEINPEAINSEIQRLQTDILQSHVKLQGYYHDPDKIVLFRNGLKEVQQLNTKFNQLSEQLIKYQQILTRMNEHLKTMKLTSDQQLKYSFLFDERAGIQAKMASVNASMQQIMQIKKTNLDPLQALYGSTKKEPVEDKIAKTLSQISKHLH